MTYKTYNTGMLKLNPRLKYVTLEEMHEKSMRDPEFRREYEALEVEFSIINDMIRKRIEKDMTQEDLAKKTGIDQATISRLESGNYNPSIKFLERIAKGLGGKLKVAII
jgi:DNA-binding XRE family transcriptional regulator